MKKFILTSMLIAASSMGYAEQPSYTFVQAGIVNTEIADLEQFSMLGYELKLSAELGYNIFAEYTYSDVDDTTNGLSLDNDQWQFSLGYIHRLTEQVTLDYRIGLGNFDLLGRGPNGSAKTSTDLVSFASNIRYALTADLEVFAGLEYQDWDGSADQKAYHFGVMYDIWGISLGAEYTKFSDQEICGLFARYSF